VSEPVESKSRSSREATLSDLQELRDLIHAYVSESQNTRLEGHQAFSTDPTPQQLKALAQHHRQTLEVEERRHQIEQTTKDNEAKRAQETKAEASRLRRENFT
jgi:hypothetical protein